MAKQQAAGRLKHHFGQPQYGQGRRSGPIALQRWEVVSGADCSVGTHQSLSAAAPAAHLRKEHGHAKNWREDPGRFKKLPSTEAAERLGERWLDLERRKGDPTSGG